MKYAIGLIALFVFAIMAVPVLADDASFPISPDPVGPGNSGPDVYLAARYFDLGVDVDGSGSSINNGDIRGGFYAFTGEKIINYVLVRDLNGAEDIDLVYWVHNGAEMGPCDKVYVFTDIWGKPIDPSFWVDGCEGEMVEIDEATNLQYDDQTDEIYKCVFTVESNWDGSLIYVEAEDTSGATGSALAENWDFNPALSVSISTSNDDPLSFGKTILDQDVEGVTAPNCIMRPDGGSEDLTGRDCEDYKAENLPEAQKLCDISFSTNKLVITNTGVPNLWPFIAASNFYATEGMAKCPFSNELDANQFEYRATSGTWDSGWRIMPQYSPNLDCLGPALWDSCRGGCRIATGCPFDILSPNNHIEVALKIVWPTPCIGTFDDGTIYVIIRAI